MNAPNLISNPLPLGSTTAWASHDDVEGFVEWRPLGRIGGCCPPNPLRVRLPRNKRLGSFAIHRNCTANEYIAQRR